MALDLVTDAFPDKAGPVRPLRDRASGGIMGTLYYGQSSFAIGIDDRALAHLKVVILTLLRSGQSVAFSFTRSGRGSTPCSARQPARPGCN